ncbi:hypothetical protein BGX26_010420 [Mortierella sp. AD094]|nr:hypothetical protein BGX26_010420 [Mortierella sp. AD094]
MDRLLESSRPRRRAMARSPGISILLLGEIQSEKSTFMEYVKKYADPDYTINLSNIGDSVSSCAEDVIRSTVYTNLPIAKLQYRFNLFDTPDLNDTRGRDEEHIGSIYKALRDAGNIHLVLVTIGKAPFSPGFQAVIKCYFDMFPEFHGLVAFVHTHFDYKDLHPKREEVYSHLTAKKGILNGMMGRSTCQHFEIDCDIKSTRPIRIGITQNIIQKILSLAPFNQPVATDRFLILKSPKMKDIDNILVEKYRAILDAQRATLNFKDAAQGAILRELYEMETKLNALHSEERDLEEYIKKYDTDDLVMIHESTSNESWRLFQLNKDRRMEFPNQEHIIHKKNIFSENVEICEEQRRGYGIAMLHVKLYTTRSSIYSNKISEHESQLVHLRSTLQGVEKEHFQYSSEHQSEMADIQKLVELNALYTRLISLLSSDRLSPEVFQHLIDAKAYSHAPLKNSETVGKVYLDVIQKDEVQNVAFNVLLLGETQSGKSTFIEFVKKYADPDYTIDLCNIGGSFSSCTEDVIRSTVHTNLPIAKVTLMISDTRGRDEEHIGSIYKALRDAGNIHLVLVTIGKAPFSPGFQAAIKSYFDMFPEFHGLVAFVHTHFDYKNLHPKREVLSDFTKKRGTLNKMMGRDTCQHFGIDCDIKSTRPIRIGVTQNIIRKILSLARFNQPVTMNKVLILKSPKMKVIDNILVGKYRAILDAQRVSLNSEGGTQGDILRKLYEMETQLGSLRSESTFNESWRVFQLNKDRRMEFPNQEHIIHKKNIFCGNVEIGEEQGGEGHSYWRIVYKRHSYEDGYLHAKLYTTRSSIYSNQISERKSQLGHLRSVLQGAVQEVFQYSSEHQSVVDIQKLIEKNVLYTRLISLLSRERLSPEVLQQLIDAKAYARTPLENSETVEKVYLDVIQKDEVQSEL